MNALTADHMQFGYACCEYEDFLFAVLLDLI